MINRRSMLKLLGVAPVAAPVLAVLPSPVYADGGLVQAKTALVGEQCSEAVMPFVLRSASSAVSFKSSLRLDLGEVIGWNGRPHVVTTLQVEPDGVTEYHIKPKGDFDWEPVYA